MLFQWFDATAYLPDGKYKWKMNVVARYNFSLTKLSLQILHLEHHNFGITPGLLFDR